MIRRRSHVVWKSFATRLQTVYRVHKHNYVTEWNMRKLSTEGPNNSMYTRTEQVRHIAQQLVTLDAGKDIEDVFRTITIFNKKLAKTLGKLPTASAVPIALTVLESMKPSALPVGHDKVFHELNRTLALVISELNASSAIVDKMHEDKVLTLRIFEGLATCDAVSTTVPASLWEKIMTALELHAYAFTWKDMHTIVETLIMAHSKQHNIPKSEVLIRRHILSRLEEEVISLRSSLEKTRTDGKNMLKEHRALTGGIRRKYTETSNKYNKPHQNQNWREQANSSSNFPRDIRDVLISVVRARHYLVSEDYVGNIIADFIEFNEEGSLDVFEDYHVVALSRALGPHYTDSMHPCLRHLTHMCVLELSKRKTQWATENLLELIELLNKPLRGTIHKYGVNTSPRRGTAPRGGSSPKVGLHGEYFPSSHGEPVSQYSKISLHTAVKATQGLMKLCLERIDHIDERQAVLMGYYFHLLISSQRNLIYQAVKKQDDKIVRKVKDILQSTQASCSDHSQSGKMDMKKLLYEDRHRVAAGESLFRTLLRYDKSAFASAYDLLHTPEHTQNHASARLTSLGYNSEMSSDSEEEGEPSRDMGTQPYVADYGSDGYSSSESGINTPLHSYLKEYGYSHGTNSGQSDAGLNKPVPDLSYDIFLVHRYRHSSLQTLCPDMLYKLRGKNEHLARETSSLLDSSFVHYCSKMRLEKSIVKWVFEQGKSWNMNHSSFSRDKSLKQSYTETSQLMFEIFKQMDARQLCGIHAVLSIDNMLQSIGVYKNLSRKTPKRQFVREAQKQGWLRYPMVYVDASFSPVREALNG